MFIGAGQEKTAVTAQLRHLGRGTLQERTVCCCRETLSSALGLVEGTLGQQHPLTAEVLECYAELLAKTNRRVEGIAMKSRSEAIWKAHVPHYCFCRTHIQVRPSLSDWAEREGSD